LCFTPSIVLPYRFDTRLNYLYKSALNYKVNINKVHFKAGWKYFLVDTLHFKTQEEKRHVTKILLQAGLDVETSAVCIAVLWFGQTIFNLAFCC